MNSPVKYIQLKGASLILMMLMVYVCIDQISEFYKVLRSGQLIEVRVLSERFIYKADLTSSVVRYDYLIKAVDGKRYVVNMERPGLSGEIGYIVCFSSSNECIRGNKNGLLASALDHIWLPLVLAFVMLAFSLFGLKVSNQKIMEKVESGS